MKHTGRTVKVIEYVCVYYFSLKSYQGNNLEHLSIQCQYNSNILDIDNAS